MRIDVRPVELDVVVPPDFALRRELATNLQLEASEARTARTLCGSTRSPHPFAAGLCIVSDCLQKRYAIGHQAAAIDTRR